MGAAAKSRLLLAFRGLVGVRIILTIDDTQYTPRIGCQMSNVAFEKISEGLQDALGFVRGDTSAATLHTPDAAAGPPGRLIGPKDYTPLIYNALQVAAIIVGIALGYYIL